MNKLLSSRLLAATKLANEAYEASRSNHRSEFKWEKAHASLLELVADLRRLEKALKERLAVGK